MFVFCAHAGHDSAAQTSEAQTVALGNPGVFINATRQWREVLRGTGENVPARRENSQGRRTLVRRASLLAWIEENENAPSPAMISRQFGVSEDAHRRN